MTVFDFANVAVSFILDLALVITAMLIATTRGRLRQVWLTALYVVVLALQTVAASPAVYENVG